MKNSSINLNLMFHPLIIVLLSFTVLFLTYNYTKKPRYKDTHVKLTSQLIMVGEFFICLFLIIIVLPIRDTLKGQILSFLGILLSTTIAISSTTILGNVLAGIMLKSIGPLKMGDFIRSGDYFGRISEKGLFHVEIQTEDKNLVTIPNIYLIAKPVKVIYPSGTIISSEVSLGYDISSNLIKKLLVEAAKNAGLEDPFVHIINLGDFSILYRVNGLLSEVKYLISAHSQLNDEILQVLHRNSIEIVSPNFMNTRAVNETIFIPKESLKDEVKGAELIPEETIFEKADMAERLEEKIKQLSELSVKVKELEKEFSSEPEEDRKKALQDKLASLKRKEEQLANEIEGRKSALNIEDE